MVNALSLLIKAYQQIGKWILPRTCRFYPSCSAYALGALAKHGVWRGGFLVLWRVLRCSPFSRGGYDPVK